ncbi:pyridoxamine 5'-phosphate oxidase family protein [Methanococcoides alaskense]|uniref:Pyridoxine 5'-phosphate oxidase superfamily flavin-nucleotide-binding protein n=1 Tax=Methanococcoides alaskense TaxID=325778 RepID=A0AA90ZCX2_9EURY|nr:pyridoxamine 5'-phosphate oxidase family protein [Methanococcoides alaskense]MDA0524804.1 pyridoxamine 5'-phosphate oxidase family protein [Methanococcoides alaskense]MDR6223072.1 putative pyridoxine 5'-phosphate oxidase superfamily flavin-nucleotide-binding protein [Methanococcoides alaskense]
MITLTEEMKAAFNTIKIFPVATASKEGVPNVVPIGVISLVDDSTIWIADNFMKKTLSNVLEDPKVPIYVWGPETKGSFQIKGDVELKTSGPEFGTIKGKSPAKGLLIVKITDVYDCRG